MIDAIEWDLANSPNSPTNDVEQETPLFEYIDNLFTQKSEIDETSHFIDFSSSEMTGAEICFQFNQDRTEAEIIGFWEGSEVINFGSFDLNVVEEMEQSDLDALFLVLDLKLR